jgi:allantoicase
MTGFTDLIDLAAERLGGAVLYANDDFFAEKENLLKASVPIFIDGKYTDRGKWMDGWESRRRRVPGHDFAIIRLGLPGIIRGVVVDTAHFKGNYPAFCSIDGCALPGRPTGEELASEATPWVELLPKTKLEGDSKNLFAIAAAAVAFRVNYLRFHIYPDGGVARLRVHGDVVPDPRWAGRPGAEVELAAAEHGGKALASSDMFFGSRDNLVMPGRSANMGDGWETKRSRRTNPEEGDFAVVRLAAEGTIERVEVDTNHFKGNFPESCTLEGASFESDSDAERAAADASKWTPVISRTKLQAHTRHFFDDEIVGRGPFTHVRLGIYPDGGVSRLRIHGSVTPAAREGLGVRHLNCAPEPELRALLTGCCGSRAWVEKTMAQRPYRDLATLKKAAADAFATLGKDDWLEAFRAHPRIGGKKAEVGTGKTAHGWSTNEQSRVSEANAATLDELARTNTAYEEKFGHIYIVCATGKSADEMLAIAKGRMQNDAATEIARAGEEQKKITEIRLDKLVRGEK